MDVVGNIVAVPELVKLVRTTVLLVHNVAHSRKAIANLTKGLEPKLIAMGDALTRLDAQHIMLIPSDRLSKLAPLINQFHVQLKSLNDILAQSQTEKKLKRIWLLTSGLEKRLEDELHQLEIMLSVLNMHLLECSLEVGRETAVAARLAKKGQLKATLDPYDHEFIPPKLDHTLLWVLSHPAVEKWIHLVNGHEGAGDPMGRLLVIHGPKGCGKSVLSATLHQDLTTGNMPCIMFSYYHGIAKQKKLPAMLSTILWQLLHIKSFDGQVLDRICDSIVEGQGLTTERKLDTIEQVLGLVKTPLYIIIDGIDESVDDWNSPDGPLKIILTWLQRHSSLHVALAGRNSALHTILGQVDDSLELTEELMRDDITKLISYKLRSSPSLNAFPDDLKAKIQQTLEELSTGMFLWVDLVFKEIRTCHSTVAVIDCLGRLPQNLDDEYTRLIQQLMSRLYGRPGKPSAQTKTARTILAFIIGAEEPLSVDDLRYGYAALCSTDPNWKEHLISEVAISECVGDFVYAKNGYIHLNHASVEEFLTRPLDEWTNDLEQIRFFQLDFAECQQLIGNACLNYLSITEFGYPLINNSFTQLNSKPLLLYAAKQTPIHLIDSVLPDTDAFSELLVKLKRFIQTPQFVGLLEYIALTLLNNNNFLEDWGSGWMALCSAVGQELAQSVSHRLKAELQHRASEFGLEHPITTSWQTLEGLMEPLVLLSRDGSNNPFSNFSELSDEMEPRLSAIRLEGTPMLQTEPSGANLGPQHPHHEFPLHRPSEMVDSILRSNAKAVLQSPALSAVIRAWIDRNNVMKRIITAVMNKMPVSLHLLYASWLSEIDSETAESLFLSALERTDGQLTFNRAWALTEHAGLRRPTSVDSIQVLLNATEQAYEILSRCPNNLLVKLVKQHNMGIRIVDLANLGRIAESEKLLDELANVSVPRGQSNTGIQKPRISEQIWFRTFGLQKRENSDGLKFANQLIDADQLHSARRVYEYLVDKNKRVYRERNLEVLKYQISIGDILLMEEKYAEAEAHFQLVLEGKHDRKSDLGQELRSKALFNLAKSVYFLERYDEASSLFRAAQEHRTCQTRQADSQWLTLCTWYINSCLEKTRPGTENEMEATTLSIGGGPYPLARGR